jgi:DNA-binding response OmpR family regulator
MTTILIIEDEIDLAEIIIEELQDAGYETLMAANGKEGLERIIDTPPDLIISDINMPQMNGHELLKTLRDDHPDLAEIPFIFLSAYSEKQQVMTGLSLGADDYISKPVDFDLLLARIKARLEQIERIKARQIEKQKNIVLFD